MAGLPDSRNLFGRLNSNHPVSVARSSEARKDRLIGVNRITIGT
jgi:hypothetical protein